MCCTRYSERFGYICRECFEQLAAIGSLDVAGFMASDKEVKIDRDVFETLFPEITY
jgi:hypothetical protein